MCVLQKVTSRYADFIGLNLLEVLGNCGYSKDHVPELQALLTKTLDGIKTADVKVGLTEGAICMCSSRFK